MKPSFKLLTIIVLNFFILNFSFGQEKSKKIKNYNQKDLFSYKVNSKKYNYWSYQNRFFPKGDTLPYFVDDREYKGILNYGIVFSKIDNTPFSFLQNLNMYHLKISINECKYNPTDSIIEIQGIISGGWREKDWKDIKNNVDVFIGQKKDTVSWLYYENRTNPDEMDVKYKQEKINKFIVLDTFTSFYLKNYVHNRTNYGNERTFKIKSKVNKNSILVFGLSYTYSEIFEIGELIFSKEKRRIVKQPKEDENSFDVIIANNERISDKIKPQNETTFLKSKDIDYYKYTQKAEDYIIDNQFKKAKKAYNILLENSPFIFARDMHNAVRCNILSKDYKSAIKWCERLALKGVALNYFDAKIFNSLKKEPIWNEFIKLYPELNNKYKKGLNTNLIKGIKDLLDEDQLDYAVSRKTSGILFQTTERVTTKLIDLLKTEGYPSEEKVGLEFINDTIFKSAPDFSVLVRHAHQQKPTNLKTLKKQLIKFSSNLEYDSVRNDLKLMIETCPLQVYKGNLYILKGNKIDEKEVKRVVFRFNNKYRFITPATFVTIAVDDPNEDDSFVEKRFDFIKKLTTDWYFYENPLGY
jgi:hypothetical protein